MRDDHSKSPGKVRSKWPPGLTVAGLVALVLLVVGGYSVSQQRSADREEIQHLQATLATSASPAEVVATREARWDLEQKAAKNLARIDILNLYNKRLTDTVTRLEKQLAHQTEAPELSESGQATAVETTPLPSARPTAEGPRQTTDKSLHKAGAIAAPADEDG